VFQLLSSTDRAHRLRRQADDLATWQIRAVLDLRDWTFDGHTIGLGQVWPELSGLHMLRSAEVEIPAQWHRPDVRLELDLGGEGLLTLQGDGGRPEQWGTDRNHRRFGLPPGATRLRCEVQAVARAGLHAPALNPTLAVARLVWLEPGVATLVRTLLLIADAVAPLGDHEVVPALLSLGEAALAAVDTPSGTPMVLDRTREAPRLDTWRPQGLWRPDAAADAGSEPLNGLQRRSIDDALQALQHGLQALQARYPAQGVVALVGHAHIDLAWLWPYDETRRKLRRTFSTVLRLIERNPEFRFVQSFAAYYDQLECDDADLLAQIDAQTSAGAWEPAGGLWVECDTQLPSGESLARQALYGQSYFHRRFGRYDNAGWLPDTFGFTPALPQILRLAGMESFFTSKMTWSETNRIPHSRLWWEGLDGSRVLTQLLNSPDVGYNGWVDPLAALSVWRAHSDRHQAGPPLLPVGFGDGGGGPTQDDLDARRVLADFPVLPRLAFTTVREYFQAAHRHVDRDKLATWVGEFYLELHRGTYTTQVETKREHRRAEAALTAAEVLAGFVQLLGGGPPASLERVWRRLLRVQFHDVLPGTSTPEVHAWARREIAEVQAAAKQAISQALDGLQAATIIPGGSAGLFVVNPHVQAQPLRLESADPIPGGQAAESGFVFCGAQHVPGLSVLLQWPTACVDRVEVTARSLESRRLRVELNDDGTLARVTDKIAGREVLAGRGNQLWAWRDAPRMFEAWDIEHNHTDRGEELGATSIEVVESGGQRGALKIVRRWRASTVVQRLRLWADTARLDFHTEIDWHERLWLLKARFPLAVRSDSASFECAFGVVRRPTHRNTTWDAAQFEVPGHRFVDLSEEGYGVALLNDGRYGHHALGNELGISLLRSPIWPDPLADEGHHEVTYALMPHAGSWLEGGVLTEAQALNGPMPWRCVDAAGPVCRPVIAVTGTPVVLSALKPAEDGQGLVLRVYEPAGARGPVDVRPPDGWKRGEALDLLERPLDVPAEAVCPFQIASWRLTPG
jgi:alpha-mannosidase